MPIQTASASAGSAQALSNSVRTQYQAAYLEAAMFERLYDQIATAFPNNGEMAKGNSVQWQFLSDMEPGTSAISEVNDITPQALRDATGSVTPTSRGEALQASELALLQTFTPYAEAMAMKVGKAAMESIDLLAQEAALQGTNVIRGAARASVDAGTTAHRADDSIFRQAWTRFLQLKVPDYRATMNLRSPQYVAIMHPAVYEDILSSGNVVEISQYQNQDILFNHEFGSISNFRLIVSPWAKVFWGAGADHGTDVIATSLSANANALATTLTVSASTHLDSLLGENIALGTEETGNTFYPKNEALKPVSATTSVLTFIAEGPNGGLRFDHTTSDVIRNADSVYTITFGGPNSLKKVYDPRVGEFGKIVGPKRDGMLDQFESLGFKFYGGYGRSAEKNVLRAEVSVSAEA